MATPLSDEIRALITFANETTEAGDTKLGDCVKTLCEGYNGGKNLPSSPLVVPSGAISSRLAALLAYANETTGAGDTTMGDAIRTLCEGYGGGELIFYEKLIGDGTAYINTKYIPTTNLTRLFVDFSANAAFAEVLGCRSGSTSNNSVNLTTGSLNKSPTYSIFYRNNVSYNLGVTATNGWKVTIKATETGYDAETLYAGSSSPSVRSITKQTNVPNCPMTIFGSNVNNVHQTYTNTLVVKRVEIVDGSTSLHLVPCTYNGEAGMWDLVEGKFYGNAASSGQFTVEGELGNPAETPFTFESTWSVYGSNVAGRMFDGNETTYGWFAGTETTKNTTITFDERCFLSKIRVVHGRDSTKNIGVYLSNDGETWELVETLQDVKNVEVEYTINRIAKYVKLQRVSGNTAWAAIKEIYFS